tara:strand:- start:313 stop:522 length:210 start_codon:yes stop_codon:yes gene_type:complete
MKNLTKDEIYSLYVDKVQVLKEIVSCKSNDDEHTGILLDIKELDILEIVMGYKHIDEYDGDELINDGSI